MLINKLDGYNQLEQIDRRYEVIDHRKHEIHLTRCQQYGARRAKDNTTLPKYLLILTVTSLFSNVPRHTITIDIHLCVVGREAVAPYTAVYHGSRIYC